MEERALLTATLYLDYGDSFPRGVLQTVDGTVDGPKITLGDVAAVYGPTVLEDPANNVYPANTSVAFTAFNQLYTGQTGKLYRATVDSIVERLYAPYNITVVDLTADNQLVNGHPVHAATTLADITDTLNANSADTQHFNSYILVAQPAIGAANDNPISRYGGTSNVQAMTDGKKDVNNLGLVFLSGSNNSITLTDSITFTADQVAHEAGHLWGLFHVYRQRQNRSDPPPTSLGIYGPQLDQLENSDLMSYLSYNGLDFFSNVPTMMGDRNENPTVLSVTPDLQLMSPLNDVSAIPTQGKQLIIVAAVNNVLHFRVFDGDGKLVADTDETRLTGHAQQIDDLRKQIESLWPPHELTYNERVNVIKAVTSIVSFTLTLTPYQHLVNDADIGASNFAYVTGTGANDIITITKTSSNTANVTVQPFDNKNTPINIPGQNTPAYRYLINTDKPIVIDGGNGNDQFVIDGDLGTTITLRGDSNANDSATKTDSLTVNGKGAASGTYIPGTNTASDLVGGTDLRGSVTIGTTTINFQEFTENSSVTIQDLQNLTIEGTAADDHIVVANSAVSLIGPEIRFAGLASLTINAGGGNDTIDVTPSSSTIYFINGLDPFPPNTSGDTLNINLHGVINPTLIPSATGDGRLVSSNRQDVFFTGIESLNKYFFDSTSLGTVISGNLTASNATDRYYFSSQTGFSETVSAFWGNQNSNDGGLDQFGSFKLFKSDGTQLAAPPNEYTNDSFPHRFSHLDDILLPPGSYYVEIDHAIQESGTYSLSISDPQSPVVSLPITQSTQGTSAVRGEVQDFEFTAIASQALGWAYKGEHGITGWSITDDAGNQVASGLGGTLATIAFTPSKSGTYYLSFELDVKALALTSPSSLGPFVYTLNLAKPAPLDRRIDGLIVTTQQADLYSFAGQKGRPLSVSAFWGDTSTYYPDDGFLHYGRFRLFGPDGALLVDPGYRADSSSQTHYFVSSVIDDFVLPSDGTYFLEVGHTGDATGTYTLGISDPIPQFASLSTTQPTQGSFGVRGDLQEYQFSATAGQALGWTYQGQAIRGWTVTDSGGLPISSGLGGTLVSIPFTPAKTGVYRLVFEDAKSDTLTFPAAIGPFSYTLSPAVAAPLDRVIAGSLSSPRQVDLYAFAGQAGQKVTVSAFWGLYSNGSFPYNRVLRLVGPNGATLAAPPVEYQLDHYVDINGNGIYSIFSRIDELALPWDGTYWVQVAAPDQGTFDYSLGIADPAPHVATLSSTQTTQSSFDVRGDSREWTVRATASQPYAWNYQGVPIEAWSISDANGNQLASGPGGNAVPIAFTPAKGGIYRLSLQEATTNPPTSAAAIGPFNYQLIPASTNPPEDTTPPSIITITADVPAATNTAAHSADVVFSEPIDIGTFDYHALALTRNGGQNLITNVVTITPLNATTYRIGNLASLTAGYGSYSLAVDTRGIRDLASNAGVSTSSIAWLMDTLAPTSRVAPLATRQTGFTFTVSATGSDSPPNPGVPTAGLASLDLYVSADAGPFIYWSTVPASSPAATFTGQSGHTYAFYSLARDKAGNIESKFVAPEASTYVPDLSPPSTTIASVVHDTPTFVVNASGTDPGGSGLKWFDFYVSVDLGTPRLFAHVVAGTPNSSGSSSASTTYQAIADGQSHRYQFYTIGTDVAGNTEAAPVGPGVGYLVTAVFSPQPLAVTNLTVQHGSVGRSFVRYVDVTFNQTDVASSTPLRDLITGGRVRLIRHELDGTGSQNIPITGVLSAIDHAIEFDFGVNGIGSALGGNGNTTVGDGYYEIDLDLDGNGTFEKSEFFYRLLGDVNADRTVNDTDLNLIVAAYGQTGTGLSADVNGDNQVTAYDRTVATRSKGRALNSSLRLDG